MTHNTTEDELLDLQDDEKSSDVDEKTSDTFDVDDRLQDGARITCDPNKDSTPASSQEISLLTSAIQMLTNRLPGALNSPLVEARTNGKSKGKRPASSPPAGVPAKKSRVGESEAKSSTSASDDSHDCQALYDSVLHSQDDNSGLEATRSGDEDEFLSELVKEYESDDTVGENLKSEQLTKLVNKMFRCKLSEKTLKERLEKQERPANCEAAKPPKVNPGIWRRLREFAKKRDLQFYKIQQALTKGILPLVRIVDQLMLAKSLTEQECQSTRKLGLEAMSLLTHASYEINMQRRLLLKPDIGKEFSALCSSQLPFTDFLFGDDLQKH